MTNKLNDLIGIPFKITGEDFKGCSCVGICWLYHKYIHNKDYPHRDGKRLWIRNKALDVKRILTVIKTWAHEVPFEDLQEGDIVLLKNEKKSGVLGVCIDNKRLLYMNQVYGSCLIRMHYIKKIFIKAFRPNDV